MTSTSIIASVGLMIFGQLLVQIIAWVKFTARMDTRVSIIENDIKNTVNEFKKHEIEDDRHHKASWARIDQHTIALAKAGYLNGEQK